MAAMGLFYGEEMDQADEYNGQGVDGRAEGWPYLGPIMDEPEGAKDGDVQECW
jgi:hypothetical protein